MATLLNKITAAWQMFVNDDYPISPIISEEILESWNRCRIASIDPYDGTCHHLMHPTELSDLLDKRKELIEIATPFMVNLYEFVKGSGFIVMLTDEQGYIIEAFGDEDTMSWAEKINFKKGAKWIEEEVGTNAIGTGLILRRPIQTSGAEHYCLKHHSWTCSAAPIFDTKGVMVGILDMSGPVDGTHLHTLGMVVAAVEAIMEQMSIRDKNRQLTIANERLTNVFLTMSDGVILINGQGVILQLNPVARDLIGKPSRELIGHSIQEILGRGVPALDKTLKRKEGYNDVEVMVDTVNGRFHCLSSGMPIFDEAGAITDVVILVRPIEKVQKLVNRFSGAQATLHFKDIIGNSEQMAEALKIAALAAAGNANVLLEGESGTGKEIFAQAIHNRSARRKGPFVAVNCGAIPRELIGSELFGYVEGAFTGAKRGGRPGKIELAAGGTLFLDEIGDMPLEHQVSLLRVLQDKKINRIGDDKVIPVDFRVICATNKNLLDEVNKGNFRQDLYYRLNVVSVHIPPLREHRDDIPVLFNHFIDTIGREWSNRIIEVDPQVMGYLKWYDWPGNVRELQNVVERLISLAEDGMIRTEHLPSYICDSASEAAVELSSHHATLRVISEREKKKHLNAEVENQHIIKLLGKHGGNITEVAREMGVCRNTVYRKMRHYGIDY